MNWLLIGVWTVLVLDAGFLAGSWWKASVHDDEPDAADVLNEHRYWRDSGPCSCTGPGVFGSTLWCELTAGHEGDHVAADGARWRTVEYAAPAAEVSDDWGGRA